MCVDVVVSALLLFDSGVADVDAGVDVVWALLLPVVGALELVALFELPLFRFLG